MASDCRLPGTCGRALRAARDHICSGTARASGLQLFPLLVRGTSTMISWACAWPDSREAPVRLTCSFYPIVERLSQICLHGSPRGDRFCVHVLGASCGPGAGREGQASPSGRGADPLAPAAATWVEVERDRARRQRRLSQRSRPLPPAACRTGRSPTWFCDDPGQPLHWRRRHGGQVSTRHGPSE